MIKSIIDSIEQIPSMRMETPLEPLNLQQR